MARTKLILICQSGGEFVIKDHGSMSYTGGEAHAVDINLETIFDDLSSLNQYLLIFFDATAHDPSKSSMLELGDQQRLIF
ncbi:unnamed protein product [Prunus armeniaca]|nr:hypothetical protein GBA52_022407 [Prunus armeniaca]